MILGKDERRISELRFIFITYQLSSSLDIICCRVRTRPSKLSLETPAVPGGGDPSVWVELFGVGKDARIHEGEVGSLADWCLHEI